MGPGSHFSNEETEAQKRQEKKNLAQSLHEAEVGLFLTSRNLTPLRFYHSPCWKSLVFCKQINKTAISSRSYCPHKPTCPLKPQSYDHTTGHEFRYQAHLMPFLLPYPRATLGTPGQYNYLGILTSK